MSPESINKPFCSIAYSVCLLYALNGGINVVISLWRYFCKVNFPFSIRRNDSRESNPPNSPWLFISWWVSPCNAISIFAEFNSLMYNESLLVGDIAHSLLSHGTMAMVSGIFFSLNNFTTRMLIESARSRGSSNRKTTFTACKSTTRRQNNKAMRDVFLVFMFIPCGWLQTCS